MLKPLSNVYCITCHNFYLILISFSKSLRRITEPLGRLTFWAFHWCDKRPLPPAPRTVKRRQIPPTEARNAQRLNLDSDILRPDLTNKKNDHLQPQNFSSQILYTYTHIRLQNKITYITETNTIHETNSRKTRRQNTFSGYTHT